jgi:copper resistance protein B
VSARPLAALVLLLSLAAGAGAQADPPAPTSAPAPAQPSGHDQHVHETPAPSAASAVPATLPPFVPPVTDAMRDAAFPDVHGHAMGDRDTFLYVLADQLEAQRGGGATDLSWDIKGWAGGNSNRFWFRTEGDSTQSAIGSSQTHLFYGRAVSRWWNAVVGLRQDVRPTQPQTWAAVGLQGLAPYLIEVEATAYVSGGGRTHVRIETEYELLLTNRLILQPLVELEAYGKADTVRQLGAGLSHIDAGLRLRYEVRRELAPYVGLLWNRTFFGTADARRSAGLPIGRARVVFGLRTWM